MCHFWAIWIVIHNHHFGVLKNCVFFYKFQKKNNKVREKILINSKINIYNIHRNHSRVISQLRRWEYSIVHQKMRAKIEKKLAYLTHYLRQLCGVRMICVLYFCVVCTNVLFFPNSFSSLSPRSNRSVSACLLTCFYTYYFLSYVHLEIATKIIFLWQMVLNVKTNEIEHHEFFRSCIYLFRVIWHATLSSLY